MRIPNEIDDDMPKLAPIALFGVIIILVCIDLYSDMHEGASGAHLAIEFFILLSSATGVMLMWFNIGVARSDLSKALVEADHLSKALIEIDRWKADSNELIQGLSVAIENQFQRWQLTEAEAEVGLFILKGMSLKEISDLRQTSERTVREQARAIYRKSGLSGRSSLSAFFLEDLLLPQSSNTFD